MKKRKDTSATPVFPNVLFVSWRTSVNRRVVFTFVISCINKEKSRNKRTGERVDMEKRSWTINKICIEFIKKQTNIRFSTPSIPYHGEAYSDDGVFHSLLLSCKLCTKKHTSGRWTRQTSRYRWENSATTKKEIEAVKTELNDLWISCTLLSPSPARTKRGKKKSLNSIDRFKMTENLPSRACYIMFSRKRNTVSLLL